MQKNVFQYIPSCTGITFRYDSLKNHHIKKIIENHKMNHQFLMTSKKYYKIVHEYYEIRSLELYYTFRTQF